MAKRGVYRLTWDAGRMGTVKGIFTATDEEVTSAIGREVYFGEVLGKHSEIYGTLEAQEVTLVTDDADFVAAFDRFKCATGYNPLKYFREDQE